LSAEADQSSAKAGGHSRDTIMAKAKELKVTLVKSKHGRLKSHKACVAGLGLRKMHQSVTVADTPENRGMINRISYMIAVEEV
jgi:large subunit ribosomal protein L30